MVDAGFLTMDVNDIWKNPADGWAWASLGADLACIVLPGAVGGRLAVKGLEHAISRSATEMHHLLPQAKGLKEFFTRAGLDIEKFKIPLDTATHRLKPNGVHTGTENWNKIWNEFIEANPNATKQEILDQLAKMRQEFGI